ncbi:pyrroline-5-carboxylate reductase [Thalassospira lucentensis]|uniref:pyrroline-5-carboxylate reductase n=1 Tax=Thalassospira lucentensis TaxID=168935 RepID=UPI003D2EC1EE
MKLGFIGTGAISDAVIRGLLTSDYAADEIIVSRRGERFSTKLAADFDKVRIEEDNQAIIDQADMIFLAVRPQIAKDVLLNLSVLSDKKLVSLIATIPIEDMKAWLKTDARFDRAIPLPAVEHHSCVTAVYPGSPDVMALFEKLGGAVAANTIDAFDGYATGSALMATYFTLLESSAQWMVAHGSDYAGARRYLAALFSGLAENTNKSPDQSFAALVDGHSTAGGLNEQVAKTFEREQGCAAIHTALDEVFARVKAASSS